MLKCQQLLVYEQYISCSVKLNMNKSLKPWCLAYLLGYFGEISYLHMKAFDFEKWMNNIDRMLNVYI